MSDNINENVNNEIHDLGFDAIPELERINATFEDFTDFLGETIIIHDTSIEDVETQERDTFRSAVMWIQVEGTETFHLTRSSAFRVVKTIEIVIEREMLPLRCVAGIDGKSHLLKPAK